MHFRHALVPDAQALELMKPGNRPFDDPARDAQSAPMRNPAAAEHRLDATRPHLAAVRIGVISAVALYPLGPLTRSTDFAAHGRNGIQQRHQLRNVVRIGARQADGQRHAAAIGQDVMLAAGPASIGRIRPRLGPPFSARTWELSTTARDQSIWSAPCKRASKTACKRVHTPARCQAANRRQQVMPEPQPISWGRSSQAMPVLSTNKMPVNVW